MKYTKTQNSVTLPRSCTSLAINFTGLGFLVGVFFILKNNPNLDTTIKTLILLLAYALPILILEMVFLKTWKRPSTGYDFTQAEGINWKTLCIKLLGFYFTLAMIALVYWLLPEYRGSFYWPYYDFITTFLVYVCLLAIPWFILLERFNRTPEDGYWMTGQLLLLNWHKIDNKLLGQHALAWLVKAFFLPLMFIYLSSSISYFNTVNISVIFNHPQQTYNFFWEVFYGIDLIVVTVGYLFAIKLFDSHIRTAEPTMSGWFWAIICYQPLQSLMQKQYLAYDTDGYNWGSWLWNNESLYIFWAVLIMLCTMVYAFSSVVFGLRFSNLTNRGILTNGPYRYSKHPAYVSKNISWWLISIPFISQTNHNLSGIIQSCLLLLAMNAVYFLRARTEERHLSADPTYVAYAQAMNDLSIFSWLGKLIPFFQYRAPQSTVVDFPKT